MEDHRQPHLVPIRTVEPPRPSAWLQPAALPLPSGGAPRTRPDACTGVPRPRAA